MINSFRFLRSGSSTYILMSLKPVSPISTLLLALGSQVGISELMPVLFDVVVALSMAHNMQNGWHW
jgi:hypothetical protein